MNDDGWEALLSVITETGYFPGTSLGMITSMVLALTLGRVHDLPINLDGALRREAVAFDHEPDRRVSRERLRNQLDGVRCLGERPRAKRNKAAREHQSRKQPSHTVVRSIHRKPPPCGLLNNNPNEGSSESAGDPRGSMTDTRRDRRTMNIIGSTYHKCG